MNIQQLMETYFTYAWQTNCDSNYLLFSEKHLCNEVDFGDSFFTKVCKREIKNLDKRIDASKEKSQKEILLSIKKMLEERNQAIKQSKLEILNKYPVELLCHNEAMYQLDDNLFHEFLQNYSDEEMYKLLSTRLGILKCWILETLNDTVYDLDLVQYLCGLAFVRKDSSKLSPQKNQLLQQLKDSFGVDYETEQIQKVLQRKNNHF